MRARAGPLVSITSFSGVSGNLSLVVRRNPLARRVEGCRWPPATANQRLGSRRCQGAHRTADALRCGTALIDLCCGAIVLDDGEVGANGALNGNHVGLGSCFVQRSDQIGKAIGYRNYRLSWRPLVVNTRARLTPLPANSTLAVVARSTSPRSNRPIVKVRSMLGLGVRVVIKALR